MTHGSLFSGIGGFDLASQLMGWDNVFHCEINPFGRHVLNYYWPNAISYEDITKTDFTIHGGTIDVLTGGFPCQPFSLAGKRKGKEDDRYLWPEMLRAIDEIRPRWVCGENVAGIVSMVQPEANRSTVESTADFFGEEDSQVITEYQQYVIETVCNDLERIGYSVQPVIIPACAVGAPHRRDRIWFVAHASGLEPERVGGFRKMGGTEGAGKSHCKERKRVRNAAGRGSSAGDASDANHNGSHRPENGQSNIERNDGDETGKDSIKQFEGCCSETAGTIASHTTGRRLRGESDWFGKPGFSYETSERNGWQDFPTQPPVRGRNDGLSAGLAGITVSKHRNESIKAYGNAIVPQVVLEIFKAIEQYEKIKQ